MTNFFPGRTTAVLCILVFACSCKREVLKTDDLTIDCRITRIVIKNAGDEIRSGNISYNSFGDPIAYTPAGYSPGSVKYEFRYDDKQRLTDYIGYYAAGASAGIFEFWTKYLYEGNRVVRDTTYHYGKYGNDISNHTPIKEVTIYTYDKHGRISGTVMRQLRNGNANGVMGDYRYVYNDDGNLVTPGASYDDKISIYRTSKVWMFINRNYSRNNIKRANGYNSRGLPSGFSNPVTQSSKHSILYFLDLNNCDIIYDCK